MTFEDAIPDMQSGDERTFTDGGHVFRVTATKHLGCDSGRRRYRVECVTCNAVEHEATTGPQSMMRYHVRDAERSTP